MATVVMLVVLRVAVGWHFLYEGVWKIKNPDKFAVEAEGFLTGARGPLAPMFHAMLPDLDGRQRLQADLTPVAETDSEGNEKQVMPLVKRWDSLRQQFVDYYRPAAKAEEELHTLHEELAKKAQAVFDGHVRGLKESLKEEGPKIAAYFEALKRYEEGRKSDPNTSFQNGRKWKEMQDLRREAKDWMSDLEAREKALKADLIASLEKPVEVPMPKEGAKAKPASPSKDFSLLAEARKDNDPFPVSKNPFQWKRIEQISFALTWGLFLMGLCLMLGVFTRPAALAGGVFMLFVVMSQPSYPGVIPPDPPQLGHALLVNKDFVEMLALFLLATTAVGRWAGFDYFLDNFVVNPFLSKTIFRKKQG